MKKILNNKKLLAGIISLIVVLIAGILFLSTRKIYSDSTKELYKAIDNTLKLNSFRLSITEMSEPTNMFKQIYDKEIYVERNTEAGTIEYSKRCTIRNGYFDSYLDFDSYCEEGKYMIAGIEVLKDDKFVFNNEEDNYHYYYNYQYGLKYSFNEDDEYQYKYNGYGELVNNLLKKLKTYKHKKVNNVYTLELEKDEELSTILNRFRLNFIEDKAYINMYLRIRNGYISSITMPINESSVKQLIIYLYDYDNVAEQIPDKIKKSLAHNYYNFVIYGVGQDKSQTYDIGSNNDLKTYIEKTKVCPNGENKISFNVGQEFGYKAYFEMNDCNGNKEIKELYIKNTSEDFNPLSNHKDDVYNLYDKETNKLIGKFKYDGNNTMKIFDSQNYNGDYVRK